jgi:hypothetical protein
MRIKMVLAGGLALSAIAISVALLHSPTTVAATNGVAPTSRLGPVQEHMRTCQGGETLPAGISAIQLPLLAVTGPQVNVEVLSGAHVITRGARATAWYGTAVRVPLRPLRRAYPHVTVCFELRFLTGLVLAHGEVTSSTGAARAGQRALPGRLSISYLRPAHASWWMQAGAVIQHMGLGRAASGTWIVVPLILLMALAIALGCRLIVRELT